MTEINLHEIIHRTQNVIIFLLKESSSRCHILFAKNRVDERTIELVPDLAKKYTSIEIADIILEAHALLKIAVDQLMVTYYKNAKNIGEHYGNRYQIPVLDTDSLAAEALEKAAFRFIPKDDNLSVEASFLSYLSTWIRQNIQKSISTKTVEIDGKRTAIAREVYSLNSNLPDSTICQIDQLTENDTIWANAKSVRDSPEALEELRQLYCEHLSMEEMLELIKNPEKGELVDAGGY